MFRILDLGSHDGFLSWYLATALKERGVEDLHIDGVELNSQAVIDANKRMEEDDFSAKFKQGAAENAGKLFPRTLYDAIVAYELIEHVPDVTKFLNAAERMIRSDGRIYISTPDGTFGSGMNPHHLRVYRALDLFELIRRRGEVDNLVIGPDGISVIAYKPFNPRQVKLPREVAIYCGPGWEPWAPTDIELKGLGGSETAAVKLAEAMSNKGFTVTVYGECEPAAYQQIVFKHHSLFDPTEQREIAIISRSPQMFDNPINADVKILWMHDTDYGPLMTEERVEKMDYIMVLSEWHAKHVREMYPFTADKLRRTRNGIEPSYFSREEDGDFSVNLHRALYTSSPDRGLDFLLEIWPRVREVIPDATLAYAYADVYNAVAERNPAIQAFRSKVKELSDQEGVEALGSLTQPQVAMYMQQSGMWLAPSWSTPSNTRFHETYCIGAVEAAAAGCHIVASEWGALPERVMEVSRSHDLIAGNGSQKPDEHAWLDAIVEAFLRGPNTTVSEEALALSWSGVADDFVEAAHDARAARG